MNRNGCVTKGKKMPPEVLTGAEVLALIKASSNRCPTGKRNRALIAVLYRAGLRISEALALLPKDMDPDSGRITILHGKGDKSRIVGMSVEAWAIVLRWMDARAKLGINGHHPVFCTIEGTRKGRPLLTPYIRRLLPRLAKRAGIVKRVHSHGFRHACASEMLDEGCDLREIQGMLGHERISTTANYLRKANPKQVVDAMRRRRWAPPQTTPEDDATLPCPECGGECLTAGILPDGQARFHCRPCKIWFRSGTARKAHRNFMASIRALTNRAR